MPDREVETIQHLLFYQYSKIIARSALGPDAKSTSYGFIKKTFRELKEGKKTWSDITREDRQLVEMEKRCIYCGSTDDLQWEHIVPKSIRINERCAECDRLLGIHNQVWACPTCNQQKHDKGLYTYFKERLPGDRKFYDRIPSLLEKKYLKTMYCCHECANTLSAADLDGDGEITVLDIDAVLHIGRVPE